MMKDLKHYFADNSRSCETAKVVENETEVTSNAEAEQNCAKETNKKIASTSTSKKRGRVKIKISKNNTRGKVCNIIENHNDLVDKTPSPFGPREIIDNEDSRDTPKRTSSCKSFKIREKQEVLNLNIETKSKNENDNSGDENDYLISNNNSIPNGDAKCFESASMNKHQNRNSENSLAEINQCEREESNAFQVLMTRKKPVSYKSPPVPTLEEERKQEETIEEAKNKLKKNRKKLITMADKKGYTKRKINEIEEAEKIEKRLEKRAKIFKQISVDENKDRNSPGISRTVSPRSLHNYFSKSIPVQKDKDEAVISSIIVKAEVHTPHSSVPKKISETRKSKSMYSAPKKQDTAQSFVTSLDLIQVLQSPEKPVQMNKSQVGRNKKARWSLRINLQNSDCDDGNMVSTVGSTEKQQQSKKDSKSRKVKEKTKNYEEVDSNDLAGPSVKSLKKRKLITKPNSKTPPIEKNQTPAVKKEIPIVPSLQECFEIHVLEEKVVNKSEKLAPLFVKRPKPDAAMIEARRAFLTSVPTENHDRINDRKVSNVGSPVLPFPTISHVTQLDGKTKSINSLDEGLFSMRKIQPFVPKFDLRELKHVTSLDRDCEKKSVDDNARTKKSNVEEVLEEIESRCSDAREIWTRISTKSVDQGTTKKSPKKRGKKKKMERDQTYENRAWTEKYRPTTTREIVGNEEAAEKFRKWLTSWKVNSDKNDDSSGDEFYSSDCSYASNIGNNQVAVLLGPHGSGKTASVYAIAEELGYSVLEINASSKRAGKKILKDLEEATQSHRIKRKDFPTLKSFTTENEEAVCQNSLILMEDIDIIFEEDEGFISATCQLASNTKRPIVMTGRNVCSHLNKMAPKQHRIYYQNTFGSRVSALLELIALAESGYRLPRSCLDRLLQTGDLRKALLQLQYLLISGKPSARQVPTNYHQSLWQDMRRCIYKPAIRGAKKSTKKKLNESKSLSSPPSDEISIMDNLANDLDKLSFLSMMIEVDDPVIEISCLKLEPSVSLDENSQDYSSTRITGFEIAKWLRDRLMNDVIMNDCGGNDLHNFRQLSLKKELNLSVNLALSQISPHTLDRYTTLLDYLSSLRTICRAEQNRTSNTNKRGNRFFHYLNTLRLPSLSTTPNILSSACKMMEEKDVGS
ncbi:ATPase family AAA domain-containing protein 5 [Venturia canescens]|uniref:ATPase family AAA domain-containing protein 5 n=1 Tax=Venturia canescens TaxID=32260 RepID=UPI001C9CB439|nr:ATPase family AAA domain-containing protein 5 [Venturia canescens]